MAQTLERVLPFSKHLLEKALKELARNQKLDKFRNQILELNNALSDTAKAMVSVWADKYEG